MLIKGVDLTPPQRLMVLTAFVYRWTKDNSQRERAWKRVCPQPAIPLVSDEEWLRMYSFHFIKSGRALHPRRHYAEALLPPPPKPVLQATRAGEYTLRCLGE